MKLLAVCVGVSSLCSSSCRTDSASEAGPQRIAVERASFDSSLVWYDQPLGHAHDANVSIESRDNGGKRTISVRQRKRYAGISVEFEIDRGLPIEQGLSVSAHWYSDLRVGGASSSQSLTHLSGAVLVLSPPQGTGGRACIRFGLTGLLDGKARSVSGQVILPAE